MKSAAKSKKEETEYNYVNQYLDGKHQECRKVQWHMTGPNKAASEAKDRVMAKAKARKKPTVTIDKPDSLVSMKVMIYKESYDAMIESGIFSDLELQNFIFDDFEEGYQRNPGRSTDTNHIKSQGSKEWQIQKQV